MKPRLARALIVLAVFAVLALLAVTDTYVTLTGAPPPPPSTAEASPDTSAFPQAARPAARPDGLSLRRVFLNQFRTYVAWALVVPGILFLARRVPLLGRYRGRAVVFHALVPLAGSLPFFFLRFLVNRVFGVPFPSATTALASRPGGTWLPAAAPGSGTSWTD
jgi:hypothetical protein